MDGRTAYTIEEFAARNGISTSTVRRLIRKQKLPFSQPGGSRHRILIPHDALARSQPEYPSLRQQQPIQKSDAGPKLRGPLPAWKRRRRALLGPPPDGGKIQCQNLKEMN